MSIDLLPETPSLSGPPSRTQRPQQRSDRPSSSKGRWWKRGLLAIGVVAVLVTAGALALNATSPSKEGPKLTHTIKRGNLIVSVTEQGTLESSDNTEIKCKVRGNSTVIWVIESGTEVRPDDVLVKLDTKVIEESHSLTKTNVHIATATLARTKADVAKAAIAIEAYEEGIFMSQLKTLEKELEIARSNLNTAKKMLQKSELLFKQGYVTELGVKGNEFTVRQAELELEVKEAEFLALTQYTKEMQLETLKGNLKASNSKLEADQAGLDMEVKRRQRAKEELDACVMKADRSGLVIYPSAAAWKDTPDITEGATVRKDQVLLLMPDLSKMQVKVGIHESIVDRVHKGLTARVSLPDKTLNAEVSSVATITRPAGWWTGNVVNYDTFIELPAEEGLKPGMSAEVEIIIARHENVLTIPVAAVIETEKGAFCWVETAAGSKRRLLQLGDSNDVFIVVEAGLKEGDKVVLNPTAYIEEAETDALKTLDETKKRVSD